MSYHHGDLSNSIINIALDAIESEGIANISIRSLAINAGVSAPALYHHFKNRNDLLVRVANAGCERLYNKLIEAQNLDGHPDQQIKNIGMAMIIFAHKNPNLYTLIFATKEIESSFVKGDHMQAIQQIYAVISDLSKRRIEANGFTVEHEVLTIATWTSIDGFCRVFIDNRNENMIYRLTGEEPPLSDEIVKEVANKLTQVYIGHL